MNATITGKCGHTAPIEDWLRGRYGGALPREHYRCPACGYYFKRVYTPPIFTEDGTGYVRRGYLTIHEKTPDGWRPLTPCGQFVQRPLNPSSGCAGGSSV